MMLGVGYVDPGAQCGGMPMPEDPAFQQWMQCFQRVSADNTLTEAQAAYPTQPHTVAAPATLPKPNQSVPPTTPILPMTTGFQHTADILKNAQAYAGGSGGGDTIGPSSHGGCLRLLGDMESCLTATGPLSYISPSVLVVGVAAFFLLRGKR